MYIYELENDFFIIIKTYGNIDLPLRVICEGVVEKTPCELTRKAPETKQKKIVKLINVICGRIFIADLIPPNLQSSLSSYPRATSPCLMNSST